MNDQTSESNTAEKGLTADEARKIPNVSIASWWRGVDEGRFPAPIYASPRSPRWFASEIRAALEKTRALPRQNKGRALTKPAQDHA